VTRTLASWLAETRRPDLTSGKRSTPRPPPTAGTPLLTNLPADQADTARVLILYKGQEAVERRYSAFKGPLAVAALFLKSNRRIAALVTVICLALLIFCLIERQVRRRESGRWRMRRSGATRGFAKARP
jgi:hypothetical protein